MGIILPKFIIYGQSSLFMESEFGKSFTCYICNSNTICNINIHGAFIVMCGHPYIVHAAKSVTWHACSQLRRKKFCLASALVLYTSVLFMVYLVPQFKYFCLFFFHCLKWPISIVLKQAQDYHVPFGEIHVLEKFHWCMSYSAVGCEFSRSENNIY